MLIKICITVLHALCVSEDIASALNGFKLQVTQLINTTYDEHINSIGDALFPVAAGFFVAELSDSLGFSQIIPPGRVRSAVRNSIKNKQKEGIKQQKDAIKRLKYQRLEYIIDQVRSLLKTISIPTNGLDERGNSNTLVRKLNRVYRFKTVNRRGEELISVIDEVVSLEPIKNSDISTYLIHDSSISREGTQRIISQFEILLRKFIANTIPLQDEELMGKFISERIKRKIRTRVDRENTPIDKIGVEKLLDYVDFSDYSKMIAAPYNWEHYFKSVFPGSEWISLKLEEINAVRRKSMHSRAITQDDFERLMVAIRDVSKHIS